MVTNYKTNYKMELYLFGNAENKYTVRNVSKNIFNAFIQKSRRTVYLENLFFSENSVIFLKLIISKNKLVANQRVVNVITNNVYRIIFNNNCLSKIKFLKYNMMNEHEIFLVFSNNQRVEP